MRSKLRAEAVALYEEHGTLAAAAVHATRRDGGKGITAEALRKRIKGAETTREEVSELDVDGILNTLKKSPRTIEQLAAIHEITQEAVGVALGVLDQKGFSIVQIGDKWTLNKVQIVASTAESPRIFEFVSDSDNQFVFGATSDNHLGSKYSREDVLDELYKYFADQGATAVFNAGNWIEGEARFNKHELKVHGMDSQVAYLAERYPSVGLTTYAVSGDDHEGWYAQREGVDIGRYAESTFRSMGREDWVDLGYMEAYVRLVNKNTGAFSYLAVVHPGGGSAYALSYSVQKIIESLEGGEKPAVGLYGHYHKLWAGNVRNVWAIQTGTTQDQTPFMRKKRLEAHVGGVLLKLEQDPETGAIVGCGAYIRRMFNRGYYNNRWGHSHKGVVLPARVR